MGWRKLSIRNILLLTIGALTFLIALLVLREVYTEWLHLDRIESLKGAVILSDDLFDVAEKLSVERDVTFSILHARDNDSISELRSRMAGSRQEVDKAVHTALEELKKYDSSELNDLFHKSDVQFTTLQELRRRIDQNILLPIGERDTTLSEHWSKDVTDLILKTQDGWLGFIKHFTDIDPVVTLHMRFKYYLGIITEYTGRERSLIGRLIVENTEATPEEVAQLLRWQGTVELGWSSCRTLADQSKLSPVITPYLKDAESQYFTNYDMVKDIFYLPGARHGSSYPISVGQWFELATEATDSLYALKDAALKETHHYVETLEMQTRQSIIAHSIVLLLALIMCFYSFWVIIHRVIRPINNMIEALVNATERKTVSLASPVARRHDEIGMLAHVLHAFRENMEEIKRTSLELKRHTHALERSNKELDDFAYIASHDLKEPLRGLFNNAKFLEEDYKDLLDAKGVSRLRRLGYLCQRMEQLVNDLLYFSRLGRQELAIGPTDLNAVIHDIESMMETTLKEQNVIILMPRPLPEIICDKTRVTEIFRNLITNAVKYNDKEKKIIEIGYIDEMETKHGIEKGIFYVRDNGMGIEEEFYEEIFRIFKRLNEEEDDKKGTGVGLTFVRKIVERHSGRIWLESTPYKGTIFYFTLTQGSSI